MGRYDNMENDYSQNSMRQKDLVLSTNEFVFIQNKTNGAIKTYTGPIMVTISQQESMVVFDSKTKKFKETSDFEQAKQLFTSAPEGWYVVLKNPAKDSTHPDAAKAVNSPELEIGRKINISGPCSFSLFPGQMAKVVQGHRLRSNQYLIARVYDAIAASKSVATIVDAEGKEVETTEEKYFVGQLLVIKGTEVSFYMPPTGIEVLAVGKEDGRGNTSDTYVRDAITLERLEYAILKDEDGEKRYVHGPAVVFPKPTETFVQSPKGGNIFRALELSPISGIYVKVIADYTENKKTFKTGEELFITGNDQMIYYPRPEHALIQYDGKYMHHAIAIPEGEGRYILDRLTGKIKTVVGPAMYLPDPRKEVVVKRKLTENECELYYPNNNEVLKYNISLNEKAMEKAANFGKVNAITDAINCAYSTSNSLDSLAIFEANANISRGVSYTKPRTITLDTKFDGVVSINVWTGYAINVLSKSGKRETVVGPITRLLDYDEILESLYTSIGKTVYLKINDNKITNVISAQTSDYINVQIKLSLNANFLPEFKDKWFNVEDYTKFINSKTTNIIKRAVKNHTIQDFYANSVDIIRKAILDDENGGHTYEDNGMRITDVEVMEVAIQRDIAELLDDHQNEVIKKSLELAETQANMKVIEALAENRKKEAELENANALYKLELEQKIKEEKFEKEELLRIKKYESDKAAIDAKNDMQSILNAIRKAEIERDKAAADAELTRQKELAAIEAEKQKAYAETIKSIMESISPDLVAAISAKSNADLLTEATKNMSAYAIANNESVSETVNRLMRGTSLEGILEKMTKFPTVED